MQASKAAPFKAETLSLEHEYEVDEQGSVIITQSTTVKSWWTYREYLSLVNEHRAALEETEKALGDAFRDEMTVQKGKIQEELDRLVPQLEKSEEVTKEHYRKMRTEGLRDRVRAELDKKELELAWWQQVWANTKPGVRQEVVGLLEEKEKEQLLKAHLKLKRKGIKLTQEK